MRDKAVLIGLTIAMLSSASYALDPLGPPKALLGPGHWGLGVEYAYSEVDTEITDGSFAGESFEGDSLQFQAHKVYANLRYGAWENVDVFARLGAATFDVPLTHDGDAGFAWGLGAAGTLYDTEKLDWGLLVQCSRGESPQHLPPIYADGSEIKAWFLQVATGPTYQVAEGLAVYGGIFYDMVRGDHDDIGLDWDFEENDPFGGFAGIDWGVKDNAHWTVEFQYAGSTLAIATGLRWFLN